ncbi:hypothetical protein ACJBVY_02095 [Streptococcus suis]|uniref:Uncharacterized protein n=1 Tax=Streptococcus suis TaxID=1307 RepID=A0A116LA49_STRSU|nr:hypothetical protein [Streptococcus suis]MDG4521518.1 hypothetical protein [Streptococcus suis]NQH66568.1 hypothetical protein [Streptococcus suis]NQH77633.1 hypothetical protein [Streptococcus suis]CYU80472.1 Uncharacterised protein [Streptococcus suis]CYV03161.1 Uncharacterised protein [Streptococcus suis]
MRKLAIFSIITIFILTLVCFLSDFFNLGLFETLAADWLGYVGNLLGVIIPVTFAIWTSKQDKIELDERQKRLENIQKSISTNISQLTNSQKDLIQIQQKIEEDLREVNKLVEQTRLSNLISLQSAYPIFFQTLDEFESEFSSIYDTIKREEYNEDVIFGFIEDVPEFEIVLLDKKFIPPKVSSTYDDFILNLNVLSDYALDDFRNRLFYEKFINHDFPKIEKAYSRLKEILTY